MMRSISQRCERKIATLLLGLYRDGELLYVGGVGTGQCTDPSMPCSLPSALSVAANGDDVTVMPGT